MKNNKTYKAIKASERLPNYEDDFYTERGVIVFFPDQKAFGYYDKEYPDGPEEFIEVNIQYWLEEQEQGDMTEDEFDNKTECLFNKPTTEQPSIELSKLSKLDLKQMLLEIFEHRMGDFTIDHYVTLIFYSLTNTK